MGLGVGIKYTVCTVLKTTISMEGPHKDSKPDTSVCLCEFVGKDIP